MSLDLKRFGAFAHLGEAELEMVADLIETVELRAGQQVMREGQEADGLLLVDQGCLRLESARCGDLGEAGPGASLGAVSLVVVGPREVTAAASEPTRLLRLTRTAFHRLVEDSPRAAARILETLVQDFAASVRSGLDRLA